MVTIATAQLEIGAQAAGAPFMMPLDAVTQAIGIVGRRGSGKTTLASVLAEEYAKHGLPFVVLDPLGVWWGLRSSVDGESEGLPVTILGGAHGDIPLERHAGALVADLVVEHPGAYILDLSAFESRAAERQFAQEFAERLYRLKLQDTSPLSLIMDEADLFAPQRLPRGEERLLGAYEAIARRGRARGLGFVPITQRPAVLNKNVTSQVECMVAMQITAPQDREAMKAWAEGFASKDQVSEFLASLASLQVGEAWVWSPTWLQTFERIQVRRRHTFDSSATPKAGAVRVEAKVLAEVDREALRARMAETIAQAEANDPQKLRAEIGRLQAQLARPGLAADGARPEIRDRVVQVPAPCDHEAVIRELEADKERLLNDLRVQRQRAEASEQRANASEALSAAARRLQAALGSFISVDIQASGPPADIEHVVEAVLARLPAGNVAGTVQVAPPEALRKKHLQAAAERLLAQLRRLSKDALTTMELLLGQDRYFGVNRVAMALTGNDSGGTRERWRKALQELLSPGLVQRGGSGGTEYKANVQGCVAAELAPHGATPEEIAQVVNSVLYQLTQKGDSA